MLNRARDIRCDDDLHLWLTYITTDNPRFSAELATDDKYWMIHSWIKFLAFVVGNLELRLWHRCIYLGVFSFERGEHGFNKNTTTFMWYEKTFWSSNLSFCLQVCVFKLHLQSHYYLNYMFIVFNSIQVLNRLVLL